MDAARCREIARSLQTDACVVIAAQAMISAGLDCPLKIGEEIECDAELIVRVMDALAERGNPPMKGRKPTNPQQTTRIKADWKPSPEDIAYAASKGLTGARLEREARAFHDHFLSKGTKWLRWDMVWQRWVRGAVERRDGKPMIAAPAPPPPAHDDSMWRQAMAGWKSTRTWPHPLGPEPGRPGCRVPRHILEELPL